MIRPWEQWECITAEECALFFLFSPSWNRKSSKYLIPHLYQLFKSNLVPHMKKRIRAEVWKCKCFSTYWSCEYWCCNMQWWKPDIQTEGGRRAGIKYRSPSVGFCVGVWWWRRWCLCVCGFGIPVLCNFGVIVLCCCTSGSPLWLIASCASFDDSLRFLRWPGD